jgi:hypothetical protein
MKDEIKRPAAANAKAGRSAVSFGRTPSIFNKIGLIWFDSL